MAPDHESICIGLLCFAEYKADGWARLGPDTMGSQSGATPFTREQWAVLCVIGSVHFGCAICVSLQAPFYPAEVSSVFLCFERNGMYTD